MRPTEREPHAVVDLADATAPDFLERHPVALLAFLHHEDDASQRIRHRLALVAAKLADPRLGVGVLDVARDPAVAAALGVKKVPILFDFQAGEVVDRLMGSPPEPIIEETLRARLR